MMSERRSYKASDMNDVNGVRAETPDAASGRRFEASQVVTMRSPRTNLTPTAQQNSTNQNIDQAFILHDITGDGNCLFRAISLYLYNTQENHLRPRADAVSYIRRNWNDIKNHLVITTDPKLMTQRNYCYNMRCNGTYGTSVEMLALSEIHQINFNIFTRVKKQKNRHVSTNEMPTVITKETWAKY